jgi:hypothetical protein
MSNPWRYRRRVQGIRRAFHDRSVSLSRPHLLRHGERSVQRVRGSCFTLSISCEDPPELSLCDHGYELTQAMRPNNDAPDRDSGLASCSLYGQHSWGGFVTVVLFAQTLWLGIYATTNMLYGRVFVYICFRTQYFCVKQTHFADTVPCLVICFPSRIQSYQSRI